MGLNGEILVNELTKDLINKKFEELQELAIEVGTELEEYTTDLESMTSKYVDKNLLDDTEVIKTDMKQIKEKFEELQQFNERVYNLLVEADHKVRS